MNKEKDAKNLADSYAAYLKVDNQKKMELLNESIDDTLTRLEELESGIKMLQAEREKAVTSCDSTKVSSNLIGLCQRMHKLDEMSEKILHHVEALEPVVDMAEANLINSTEGKLKNMLKPLLLMRPDIAAMSKPMPTTFKTASFFPKQGDSE